jgi:hypothetical protein
MTTLRACGHVQDARRAVARFVDEAGPFCKLLAWLRRAARGDPAPLTPVPPLADGRGGSEWVFCGEAASSLVSDVVGLSTRAAVEALVRQMRVMRAKLIEEGLESHAVRTPPASSVELLLVAWHGALARAPIRAESARVSAGAYGTAEGFGRFGRIRSI